MIFAVRRAEMLEAGERLFGSGSFSQRNVGERCEPGKVEIGNYFVHLVIVASGISKLFGES